MSHRPWLRSVGCPRYSLATEHAANIRRRAETSVEFVSTARVDGFAPSRRFAPRPARLLSPYDRPQRAIVFAGKTALRAGVSNFGSAR
jgi:hypothetical protein